MRRAWEDFRIAAAFLTIFPTARSLEMTSERLGRCMGLFPAVGLALGLGLVGVMGFLAPLTPKAVMDSLLVLVLIVATGALHLDGIADLVDGLAGGKDQEGTLRIMKDSRVGAMGVVALVMVIFLKYLFLHNVPGGIKAAALIFTPAAGRWAQVALAATCSYVRPEGGTGGAFVDNVGARELLLGSVTLALAALVLFGWQGAVLLLLLGGAGAGLVAYFRRRLGGVTGDVLGAATEVVEVLTLLLVTILY
ncbi:MAG: adenosylcobinamide-GDP ribazoletransferase [Desulfuromonas sp.]|uniref:adenosylcobinamide-GDP ribazoletransferase n=1 Tax=Desulfuromonas sp. TaxID=892 RepID=UPI000CA88C29|nr:adenosylcobinamide-GDP ribazoletransferase [Desulfuromonas sp.]PLX83744.1 MAG: adenosylcobinamide-GDP ribazoletransferase [Desulfuromonas sp.]